MTETSTAATGATNPHLAAYEARGLKGRILSGVQPTGNLHLGNYLGAIRNFARLQDDYECLYCVVDQHAITVPQDPKMLAAQTREIASAFLAAGVDGTKQIVFNQSMVPEHAQLAWIFNCVARMGWMSRMTQFKEKAGKDRENVSLGLFAYPALMAADILIYKATHVPVGEDQKQHLELTRDIAIKFNNDFSQPDFFPITEPLIFGAATRVDADAIAQKIRRAKTDPLPMPDTLEDAEKRPDADNLLGIYAALADQEKEAVVAQFAGRQFSEFKTALTELAVAKLGPIGAEMQRLMKDPGHVDGVLRNGAQRARAVAAPILDEVYRAVGFLKP